MKSFFYLSLATTTYGQLTCGDVKRVFQESSILDGGTGCCGKDSGSNIGLPDCSPKTFDYEDLGNQLKAYMQSLVNEGTDAPEYFNTDIMPDTLQNKSSLVHDSGFPKHFKVPWMGVGVQCADEPPAMWAEGTYKNSEGTTLNAEIDTPFNMASINEITMHLAMYKLWQMDKIQLDDPVSMYIPLMQNVTQAKVMRSGSKIVEDLHAHPENYGAIEGPFTHNACLGEALIGLDDEAAQQFAGVCKSTTYYLEETRIPTIRDAMGFSAGMIGTWRPLYEPGLVEAAFNPAAEWSANMAHTSLKMNIAGISTPFPATLDQRTALNAGLSADGKTLHLTHAPGRVWSYNEMYVIASILLNAYDGPKPYGLASVMKALVLDPLGMTDTHYAVMDMDAAAVDAYNKRIPIPVSLTPSSPSGYVDGAPSLVNSQIAPNGYEAVFFEGYAKTTMRDLLRLGSMFANDGWSYATNSRYLAMADVLYGMQTKTLRTHPIEDLVVDYFKTNEDTGYFGDLDIDTNFFGYSHDRDRYNGYEPFPERSNKGTKSSELAATCEYCSGWYGIFGQALSWQREVSRCAVVSTTAMSYNGFTQKAVRDTVFRIIENAAGPPRLL